MKKHIVLISFLMSLSFLTHSLAKSGDFNADIPPPAPGIDFFPNLPVQVTILTQQNLFQLRMLDAAQRLDTYGQYLFLENEELGQAYVDAGIEAQHLANLQLNGIQTNFQLDAYLRIQRTLAQTAAQTTPSRRNLLIQAVWETVIAHMEGHLADLEEPDDDNEELAPIPGNPFPLDIHTLIQQASTHPYVETETPSAITIFITGNPYGQNNDTFF
ncbi:MAG TPA: hypothetical protein DIU37_06575 [Opitutae bacterium]|nr:hypothetical protein [Opitutae bacterium]|tara:strand:+ start:2452 stop:3096 length:645 start_codon:yes stop_codon:yes gene_type:complete